MQSLQKTDKSLLWLIFCSQPRVSLFSPTLSAGHLKFCDIFRKSFRHSTSCSNHRFSMMFRSGDSEDSLESFHLCFLKLLMLNFKVYFTRCPVSATTRGRIFLPAQLLNVEFCSKHTFWSLRFPLRTLPCVTVSNREQGERCSVSLLLL